MTIMPIPRSARLNDEVGQGATSLPAVRQGISFFSSQLKARFLASCLPAGMAFGMTLIN